MPKSSATITEKLTKLEQQKEALIKQRHNEILSIIQATGSLTIDDKILAGFLLFIRDEKNKDHPILEEFKTYLKPLKANKTKAANRKQTNKNTEEE